MGLEAKVTEQASNWSRGQRQLLCLARVLLRKPRILVLDEMSASIDIETDAIIQRRVRENLGDCTILSIAHRLLSIADSDRILVLDKGHVMEFDTPAALLSRGGLFADMVDEHGETAARHIRALADGGSLVDLMKTGEFASLEASARALELSGAAGRSSMVSLQPLARPEAPPAYDSSSISWSAEPMTAGPSQA